MSNAYYNMYKRFIEAGRTESIIKKLNELLDNKLLTTEEYEGLKSLIESNTSAL